ncbi:hypothetical protein V6N12_020583 [Hibiscus sabdariffa]|uniref:Uncharacterized protein n=1 Tax=Hibiscus sabdariffa TaxID=183260 RepID=A0ABR2CYI6_9ROSI
MPWEWDLAWGTGRQIDALTKKKLKTVLWFMLVDNLSICFFPVEIGQAMWPHTRATTSPYGSEIGIVFTYSSLECYAARRAANSCFKL